MATNPIKEGSRKEEVKQRFQIKTQEQVYGQSGGLTQKYSWISRHQTVKLSNELERRIRI
jgi:hypothetical protein